LPPGESAVANLKLQDEVLALPGDRFIVRQFSPVVTIGGGAVLDPLRGGRCCGIRTRGVSRKAGARKLRGNTGGDDGACMLGLGYEEIVARTGWTEKEIQAALENFTERDA